MPDVLISHEAQELLLAELRDIKSQLKEQTKQTPLSEAWLDNYDVCNLLKISRRTLQSYRDEGEIEYSIIGAKIFYSATSIEIFLQRHSVKYSKK